MFGKFYTSCGAGRKVILYARSIKDAHVKARDIFGKGVSFTTRESTLEETKFVKVEDVIYC